VVGSKASGHLSSLQRGILARYTRPCSRFVRGVNNSRGNTPASGAPTVRPMFVVLTRASYAPEWGLRAKRSPDSRLVRKDAVTVGDPSQTDRKRTPIGHTHAGFSGDIPKNLESSGKIGTFLEHIGCEKIPKTLMNRMIPRSFHGASRKIARLGELVTALPARNNRRSCRGLPVRETSRASLRFIRRI